MVAKKDPVLSPHLTIYKPQITSVFSILHRASGVFLFFGIIAICWGVAFAGYGRIDATETFVWQIFSHPVGKVILILWSYTLFFHFFTGIRHLFWDIGCGFSLKAVTATAIVALIASLFCASITWFYLLK